MQRVSSLLPLWERAKPADNSSNVNSRSSIGSNASNSNRNSGNNSQIRNGRPLNKVFSWADRIGTKQSLSVSATAANAATATASANPVGREAYWPTTLDRECEKAARILKSFCTDGFLDEAADIPPASPTSRTSITSLTSPRFSSRRSADLPPSSPTTSLAAVKKKIPPRIIQEAVGLAIFSCMRSGLWMSGSGGSGILIARKADGTWSPPSGILLHTSTVAFVLGVDIYDCVLVINSVAALELFTRPRLTLGAEVPLTVGPLVAMGLLENDVRLNNELGNTVLTYLKARGRHSPAQLSGSLVTERSNENERFYSDDSSGNGFQPVDILDILAGNVRKSIPEILPLFEAIKAAEGRIDFDTAVMDRLSQQPAPGDADIADTPSLQTPVSPKSATFGIPDASDPDPFGIIALEMAGLEIREAGSKHRPSSHQFDYTASPTSPVFASHFSRQSADITAEQGNRASYMSTRTQATSMTDAYTQTDVAETPDTSLSPTHSDDGKEVQAITSRDISSPVPEVTVQTALKDSNQARVDPASADNVTLAPSGPMPPTVDTTEMASKRYLTVDHGVETSDLSEDDTMASSPYVADERDEDADDEDEETDDVGDECGDDLLDDTDDIDVEDDDEPIIFEVATTTSQPVRVMPTQVAQIIQAKGALVNIPKRVPPPLPLRSPARTSRASKSDYGDLSNIASPLRQSFQSTLSTSAARELADAEPSSRQSSTEIVLGDAPVPTEVASATPAPSTGVDEKHASPTVYESATTVTEKNASGDDAETSTPQATEPTTSSVDGSDHEPRTPRVDDIFKSVRPSTVQKGAIDVETNKTQTQQDFDVNVDSMNTPTVTVA